MIERVRLLARRHAGFVVTCAILMAGFQFLIGAVVGSLDLGGTLQAISDALPAAMRRVLEQTFTGDYSARGLVAFGWGHPIPLAIGAGVAVMLAARAIAGAAEDGTIELALVLPVSRTAHLGAEILFALMALAVVAVSGAAGAAAARAVFDLEGVGGRALARLAVNWWALQAAWYGVALAVSSWSREGRRAAGIVFVLAVASLVAEVIGRLWLDASFILPWTLYDYFVPRDLLLRHASIVRPSLILLAVLAAGLAVAIARFRTRDLP